MGRQDGGGDHTLSVSKAIWRVGEGPCAYSSSAPTALTSSVAGISWQRTDEVRNKTWLEEVLAIELEEKTRRSLAHRRHIAGIGTYKPVSSFDWKWPRKIGRPLIEELFSLDLIADGTNIVLLGPNGVGKTMLLRNIAD